MQYKYLAVAVTECDTCIAELCDHHETNITDPRVRRIWFYPTVVVSPDTIHHVLKGSGWNTDQYQLSSISDLNLIK